MKYRLFNILLLGISTCWCMEMSAFQIPQPSDSQVETTHASVDKQATVNNPPTDLKITTLQIDSANYEAAKKHTRQKKRLHFTENIGQLGKDVRFHINDLQADHFLMNNEIRTVLKMPGQLEDQTKSKVKPTTLRNSENRQNKQDRASLNSSKKTSFSYGLKFIGTAGPQEVEKLHSEISEEIGKKNYFKGKKHYKDIPLYGQVRYDELWKGIDVDFYESDGQLKYDFVVAPGAKPDLVKFQMNGVSQLKVDTKTGELQFITPLGQLAKGAPYTYQIIKGQKVQVKSAYQINGEVISFQLGAYDKNYPLIIDPIALKFATFLGGNASEFLLDIYVHPISKKIYLTGYTESSSFPGLIGTNTLGGSDGYITCMSRDGSTVLWTTIIGGDEGSEDFQKIYVSDDENDIFVSGSSRSNDYPTNGLLPPFAENQAGNNNPVITRLNGDGTVLKYSTYFPVDGFSIGRFTVVGDIVYGATYYDAFAASSYPITMPPGAYQPNPPSNDASTSEFGQIFFGINTARAGTESLQYGTYFYDDAPNSYSNLKFADSGSDGDGNIYFGGYMDIGEPSFGPNNLFGSSGIQSVSDIYNTLTASGSYSSIGWLAQFDSTLSNLIYTTPIAPVLHPDYVEILSYDYLFNLDISPNGDIYTSHQDKIFDVLDINDLVIAPSAKFNNLQPLTINSSDALFLNTVTKIAATDRSQYEYIVTAAGDNSYNASPGAIVDDQDRLHWSFPRQTIDVPIGPLSTEGALQSEMTSFTQTQYIVLTAAGDLEYATIVGPSIDFNNFRMKTVAHASFVTNGGSFYLGGFVRDHAQRSFPVTPSYWDEESGTQVFVHDATPSNNLDAWLAVFQSPAPSDNIINDFAPGNNTFCVDGIIYQEPNYGPITGDPVGFLSGDGSSSTHNIPNIRPAPFTEAHPDPSGGNLHWEVSRDNGVTWTPIPGTNFEVYKPQPEVATGTVQYRRVYTYGVANTEAYSNVATATISGTSSIDIQSPTDPVYYCPGTTEDFTFSILGTSGNISWQWYDGFTPLNNAVINPASGTDLATNFTATIPAGSNNGGFYRLVVEDAGGCAAEVFVRILPKSDNAGSASSVAICLGDVSNDITLGPGVPNPDFEYSWTGPSGFTSNDPNPVVSLDGIYNLQVRQVGDASFCVGGQTSVEVLPFTAHDPVLRDTSINLSFCQTDAPLSLGLAGPAPSGYVFQWSPNVAIDDATAFNPNFYPSTLPFGPPVSDINYTFSALRQSDGCVFEDTISVSITAIAGADAGRDENAQCDTLVTVGGESSGDYFEWTVIETSYPGGVTALTSDPIFKIDGVAGNLGTNELAEVHFPFDSSSTYSISLGLKSSYVPFPNTCFASDTMMILVSECTAEGSSVNCPNITTSEEQGADGVCDLAGNILGVTEWNGATYEWTTYAVDGVIQPSGTAPRGLFEVLNDDLGTALSANGPHPIQVKTDLEDAAWGWPGAAYVEYEITATKFEGDTLLVCSDRIIVYSNLFGAPVVDLKSLDVCLATSPGVLSLSNGVNLPYTISGSDYNSAPNSALVWTWAGGAVANNQNSPFPTLNPTESTPYTVIAVDSLTGCYRIDTFEVRLNQTFANAGADVTQACEGSVVQLGSTQRANHTYQWNPSSGLSHPVGTPNDTVPNPYILVPNASVEYEVTATDLTTGCQAVDTVQIIPNTTAPTAPATASYNSCPDGEVLIGELYSNSAGVTFNWSAGAGGNLSWLDNTTANQANVTLPPSFTGAATFTLTVTNGVCGSASTDYTITNQVADVALGPDVTATCTTPLIPIGSATKTASFNYFWTPSEGLYLDDAGTIPYTGEDTNTVYTKPLINTTYTLLAYSNSTACSFSDQIIISPPAGVDVDAGNDVVLCPGETAVNIGQSGSGTISWSAIGYNSDPSGTPATPSTADSTTMISYLASTSSATTTFTQATTAPGIYEYRVTSDYGGGCIATDDVLVTVSAVPVGLAGGNKTACDGSASTIGTTAVSGVSYNWAILSPTAQSGTISNTTIAAPSVDPQETTSYELVYTDIVTGCTTREIITVSVIASPVLNDASIGPVCSPVTAQDLTAAVPGYSSLSSATWFTDYVGGPTVTNPTAVNPSRTTNYFLIGTNTNGCSDEAIVTINIESPEVPTVASAASISCLQDSLDLVNYQGSPSHVDNSFVWHSDNTNNPATLLTNTVVGPGTYYIFETSPNGCYSESDNLTISQDSCPDCDGDGIYDFEDYCPCDSTSISPPNSYGCGFPDTCSFFVGDTLAVDTVGANYTAGYLTVFILANTSGTIVNTSYIPEFPLLSVGEYMIVSINYEDDGSISNLLVGNELSDVSANCFDRSDALSFRVCNFEICDNGIDDDLDGFIDCADDDCPSANTVVRVNGL